MKHRIAIGLVVLVASVAVAEMITVERPRRVEPVVEQTAPAAIQTRVGAGATVSGVSVLPPADGETDLRLRVQVER